MDKIERHDIEIGRYILSVLGSKPEIVTSWGIDPETLTPVKYGIEFHVQGFKHRGNVRVTQNEGEDLFEVCLISETGETAGVHKSVCLDNLVSVIDDAVEKTEDYEKRIAEEYPFLRDSENPENIRIMEIIIL